ncbi:MAG: gliding motility-associated C-terminal domain-containing protein [Salinivirgaceae bacterium]
MSKKLCFLLLAPLVFVGHVVAQDLPDPDAPVIDSISVIRTDGGEYRNIVGWQPYDWEEYNTDSCGFVIYRAKPQESGFVAIDSIKNHLDTSYVDRNVNPMNRTYSLAVAAYYYRDGTEYLGPYHTIFARNILPEIIDYDSCATSVSLEWNTYFDGEETDQPDPPYTVIAKSNNGDYRVEITSSPSFVYSELNENEQYTFFIRIKTDNWSTTSTPVTYYTESPPTPAEPRLLQVQTNDDFSNEIIVEPTDGRAEGASLFRGFEIDGAFEQVASQPFSGNQLTLKDDNAPSDPVYYYVQAFDNCNDLSTPTDTVNTIILHGAKSNRSIELNANVLEGYDAEYEIERMANNSITTISIASPVQYTDNEIFNLTLENPKITYQMIATVDDTLEVISNTYETEIYDDLLWPNAIIAGYSGADGVFRPFIQQSVPVEYQLKIYSKWGQLLFETRSYDEYWNATFEGSYVAPGAYLYVATYKFTEQKAKTIRGTVTVIH